MSSYLLIAGIAVAVLAIVAFVVFRPKKPPQLPEAKPIEPSAPIEVSIAPSALEQQKRQEAEAARQKAAEIHAQREALSQEASRALKEQEEEAKREAYRAEKKAEEEAKERKKREREETERLEKERAEQALQLAEQQKKDEEDAQRKKAEAQSGQTLAAGLQKTRTDGFMGKLNRLFSSAPKVIDETVLGELEEILFTADIGVKTASSLVDLAREKAKKSELQNADKLKDLIRGEIERIVDLRVSTEMKGSTVPHVIMVVGVNGAGKTTTIGKLAAKASLSGRKVVLAAGDTFRAAAAEQLDVWSERAKAELVKGKEDADPASVIFEAIKKAKEIGADLVIADTAGRLHTKAPLMEELKKVKRVMEKALPGAPHEVLLVMDATMGQNGIAQAKQFHEAVKVTSIVLTKLDGTAKGGVIIGICDELKLPVAWTGIGETVADLRAFDPKEFVAALFDVDKTL